MINKEKLRRAIEDYKKDFGERFKMKSTNGKR